MKQIQRVLLTTLVLATLGTASGVLNAASNKVTICHVPPGNPGNAHSITVSRNAVRAHTAHGDTVGVCGAGESSSAIASATPSYVVCDGREGETGRQVSISLTGRLHTEHFECD